MFRRQHLLVSLSVAFVTTALACSDDKQATPRVALEANISPGKHTVAECPQSSSPWFSIGSFGNPKAGKVDENDPESPLKEPVIPIEDGATDQQGTVAVTCSVIESGDGFDIAATAQLDGATGGAFTITGHLLRGLPSPNILASIGRKGETYVGRTEAGQPSCSVTFDSTLGHTVAAGRAWGLLDCPDARNPNLQRVCETSMQFRFENCSQ